MELKPVKSSNIKAIGYDSSKLLLRVAFLNGSTYEYKEVPKKLFLQFSAAISKGQFLADNIRNNFKYSKV